MPLDGLGRRDTADEGLTRAGVLRESVAGDKKVTSSCLMAQAVFKAEHGRFDEAREL